MENKVALLLSYLQTASAETRHVVMQNYPKELPMAEVVAYLKDDPATEKATALLMYWMMHPRFSKQFEPEEARVKEQEKFGEIYFDLIEDIERKYAAGFYTAQTIAYDPYYDYSRESGYFGEKRRMPSIMSMPVYGKTIDTALYDREHGLQHGLTAELLAAFQATKIQGERVQDEGLKEEKVEEVQGESLQGEKVQGERVEEEQGEGWKSENVEDEKVEVEVWKSEDEERVEEEIWGKVEEEEREEDVWGKVEEDDEYAPYAPNPIPETQSKPNNTMGCGFFIAIAVLISFLMRTCEN